MNDQKLMEIRLDIRKNFGKPVNWEKLPIENFNCYMFAANNTIPTEILDYQEGRKIFLTSLICEDVAYFGNIGQFCGKTDYKDIPGLIEAVKGDLETMGYIVDESFAQEKVTDHNKIAFYYDVESLLNGKHGTFHFIRQVGDKWLHKSGWTREIEEIPCSIEELTIAGVSLIGYFKLGLNPNLS